MNTASIDKAKGLLTPRKDLAEKGPGVSRSELVSSQRMKRIEAVYLSSEKSFEDDIEAANEVGAMVRQTLSLGSIFSGRPLWSYDEKTDSTMTNCYGHTVVASELLEAIEVPHFISFANGHSFVVLSDDETSSMHMIDAPSKELFISLDGVVKGRSVRVQLDDPNRRFATNLFDADVLMQKLHKKPRHTLLEDHPWLSTDSPLVATHAEPSRLKSTELILRTYPPVLGRRVVQNYGLVVESMVQKDFVMAAERMSELQGIYPNVDARAGLGPVMKLRHELGKRSLFEPMQDIAGVIDSSLDVEGRERDNTKNQFFYADTIRHIGSKLEDPEVISQAEHMYPENGAMANAKKAYARRLIGRYS